MSNEMRILVVEGYGNEGSVNCEWRCGEGVDLVDDAKLLLKLQAPFSVTVLKNIVKSTDYDESEKNVSTGPFAVVITHYSEDALDKMSAGQDEADLEDEPVDSVKFVDTLDEAMRIYDAEIEKDSLYVATIMNDIEYSNVYKNGVPVGNSLLIQSDRVPETLKSRITSREVSGVNLCDEGIGLSI